MSNPFRNLLLPVDGAHMLPTMDQAGRRPEAAEPTLTNPRPARWGVPTRPLHAPARSRQGGRSRVYQDRTLTCRDCADEFTFSSGEQAFFASKGLQNDPQRCPSCRAAAKRARSAEGPREFHAAVCGACGGQAVVPFAPRNDRPVYCSACFDKVRAGNLQTAVTV